MKAQTHPPRVNKDYLKLTPLEEIIYALKEEGKTFAEIVSDIGWQEGKNSVGRVGTYLRSARDKMDSRKMLDGIRNN
jgi:hypothetical protein